MWWKMTGCVTHCANGLQRAYTLILPFMSSIMFQYFFRNICATHNARLVGSAKYVNPRATAHDTSGRSTGVPKYLPYQLGNNTSQEQRTHESAETCIHATP